MDCQESAPKKRSLLKTFFRILFTLSIIINLLFIFMLVGIAAFASLGQGKYLVEKTLIAGQKENKIAVINIEGVIDFEAEQFVQEQIDTALDDKNIKGLILKIQSPGGSVWASDNIHHYITTYKQQSNKPIICFMDGLAASGGYYAAVACDKIIASPTTVTGSIGVIMGHMDISKLLEEKLGIKPTTIKSGEKKDWPSMYREISIEEKAYLMNKLVEPAYSRFVQIVVDGRKNLSNDEVTALADGSIYFAQEALQKGLIDDIGYFEAAVAATIKEAGIENARVVEYSTPFSFSELVGSQSKSVLNISKKQVVEMTTPELMYLWTGKN